MSEVKDILKAIARPVIEFRCQKCGEFNRVSDSLLLKGEHVEGIHVKTDRIDCYKCGAENLVYR